MKNKIVLLIFLLSIGFLHLYAKKSEEILWKHKFNDLAPHYIFNINNKLYCFEIGKGYQTLDLDKGRKINSVLFKNEDERKNLMDIKVLPDTGVFGVIYLDWKKEDKEKSKFKFLKEDQWIVEIKENFIFNKIRLNQVNEADHDYIISRDKKRYFFYGFLELLETYESVAPLSDRDKAIYFSNWRDIKTSKVVTLLKNRDLKKSGMCQTYYLNSKFFMFTGDELGVFNNDGKLTKIIEFAKDYIGDTRTDWITRGEDYYRYAEISIHLPNNLWKVRMLDCFIYGDDGYFYLTPININDNRESYKYYIIKIDKDLNMVGKRNIILSQRFTDPQNREFAYNARCISGISVDKDGYIYIISDKEGTITKYTPIKNGEDSKVFVGASQY